MSQSYEQRLATVEGALVAQNVSPAKGQSLSEAAAQVLHALDHIPETLR